MWSRKEKSNESYICFCPICMQLQKAIGSLVTLIPSIRNPSVALDDKVSLHCMYRGLLIAS